ncbi:glycosyltransferase family 4 protein [Pedobacter namyangjuensis]|uniref:glycosyltransferase family 4 protein n=1 Tax=Pedobacter namyangjuensis TaxID=600626 RepID=UPI001F069C01|nr:glycosyltransferase family 4 protein [Pedobacter namyangjuensis]
MKIAIIADPFIPVPPENYGGIERIIDFLVRGLIAKGHQVLLVANEDSNIDVPLLKFPKQHIGVLNHIKNMRTIAKLHSFQPDVIHSFGRLAYLLPFAYSKIPKVMSYQREPTVKQIINAQKIFRQNTLSFTGCSEYISKQIMPYAKSTAIHNGVETFKYDFVSAVHQNAPLVFLGRIEPIKGTHIAIAIAEKTGKELVIAGNIPPAYQTYFDEEIKPKLSDQIKYVGAVNDKQKKLLLGNAIAFLMPIKWNEPFGIVMAEAMACGTPVIAFNRGSVPEVVNHGLNGFRCNTVAEMVELVGKVNLLSREAVRKDFEERFSAEVIINQYLNLYKQLTTK